LSDAKSLLPLKVRVVYNTILFARDRIQELLRQVQQLLSMVAKNQDEKVSGKILNFQELMVSYHP